MDINQKGIKKKHISIRNRVTILHCSQPKGVKPKRCETNGHKTRPRCTELPHANALGEGNGKPLLDSNSCLENPLLDLQESEQT